MEHFLYASRVQAPDTPRVPILVPTLAAWSSHPPLGRPQTSRATTDREPRDGAAFASLSARGRSQGASVEGVQLPNASVPNADEATSLGRKQASGHIPGRNRFSGQAGQ